jgi:hypothetical protein
MIDLLRRIGRAMPMSVVPVVTMTGVAACYGAWIGYRKFWETKHTGSV